jgi:hypothetical protein
LRTEEQRKERFLIILKNHNVISFEQWKAILLNNYFFIHLWQLKTQIEYSKRVGLLNVSRDVNSH